MTTKTATPAKTTRPVVAKKPTPSAKRLVNVNARRMAEALKFGDTRTAVNLSMVPETLTDLAEIAYIAYSFEDHGVQFETGQRVVVVQDGGILDHGWWIYTMGTQHFVSHAHIVPRLDIWEAPAPVDVYSIRFVVDREFYVHTKKEVVYAAPMWEQARSYKTYKACLKAAEKVKELTGEKVRVVKVTPETLDTKQKMSIVKTF